MKWSSVVAFLLFFAELQRSQARVEIETTRQEILESRRRRGKQLEDMLRTAKQQLADHRGGIRLLDDEEFQKLERRVEVYEKKLETMQGDLDDREVERILKREQLRNERVKERRARREEL